MAKLPEFNQPLRGRVAANEQALQQASFALQMQRLDEAERIAADVLKANRGDMRALQILTQALVMQGHAVEAVERLERAAKRSDDPAVATHLAIALRAAGRQDEALATLEWVTARKPPFPTAFLELAQQLVAVGRHDDAIAVLRRGAALLPDVAELLIQLGYLLAARNERTEACALLSQALAGAPDRLDAMYALAYTQQAGGNYAAAVDTYRRFLAHKPDDAPARLGLGICLLETRDAEKGLDCFRRVMRDSPKQFGKGLSELAGSVRGRFWLRPSDAARFMRGETAR
jgi:tetratricopeptide (TPR) repeat protein